MLQNNIKNLHERTSVADDGARVTEVSCEAAEIVSSYRADTARLGRGRLWPQCELKRRSG